MATDDQVPHSKCTECGSDTTYPGTPVIDQESSRITRWVFSCIKDHTWNLPAAYHKRRYTRHAPDRPPVDPPTQAATSAFAPSTEAARTNGVRRDPAHPLLALLFDMLPPTPSPWPFPNRQVWLHALEGALDLIYQEPKP